MGVPAKSDGESEFTECTAESSSFYISFSHQLQGGISTSKQEMEL